MPYHGLLTAAEADLALDLANCVGFVPDDQFGAYCYP